MDRHTKEQRSRNMSAVRSSGNKTTELRFVNILKINKITSWRRYPKNTYGKPDFIFPKQKVAIFIDGCFWHGCAKHRNIPATNRKFWLKKILSNKKRDEIVSLQLKKQGLKVMRIWEHELGIGRKTVIRKLKRFF